MLNLIITKKICQLIAQTYAIPFEETYEVYSCLNSFDNLILVIEVANKDKISLSQAFNIWKSDGKMSDVRPIEGTH